ncbi:hypothetical protein THOM_0422 [Trachipleistophora hominis]|uniref:Uncharacterized protein n=1 Tax=Trachipleistophora hominis TaxID=72359 RepID=L7K056_TRAHO|nr:hypothetical protein THOM_0422 [Trachipleistophora hominis]
MAKKPAVQARTAFKRPKSDTIACHQAVNRVEETLLPAKMSALRTLRPTYKACNV